MKMFALALSVLWLLSETAMAKKAKEKSVSYKDVTQIDFEEKGVDGQFMNPNGQDVQGDQNVQFDSLLDSKKDFRKELKRSSGAIR
jgi:hypothetical protein